MKIQYTIAAGYKQFELKDLIDKEPSADPIDVIGRWVQSKYGTWIANNITLDFSFQNVTDNDFVVDFPKDKHALDFVRQLGGRFLEAN